MGAALADFDFDNGGAAAIARGSFPVINMQLVLHRPAVTIGIHERMDTGAAKRNRLLQFGDNGIMQRFNRPS